MALKFHMQYDEAAGLQNDEIQPGPDVIKLFPCSTQLSMKFFPLINVKMPTIVGTFTFMSGKIKF